MKPYREPDTLMAHLVEEKPIKKKMDWSLLEKKSTKTILYVMGIALMPILIGLLYDVDHLHSGLTIGLAMSIAIMTVFLFAKLTKYEH